ncbi:hypothetical protein MHY85_02265 [Cellulomonas sp. ACRRI]|uniref:hypothetical protein n=1 Tax=Cellulomonas sp. ACRRI TaxID=2918188 RepID=UPI001EF1B82F|nr:hypothetical protein [Cellulomonas sp. ACRRI]MCG7284796.1 hypothetical protein [Cellulomonas sp. ACRRI]
MSIDELPAPEAISELRRAREAVREVLDGDAPMTFEAVAEAMEQHGFGEYDTRLAIASARGRYVSGNVEFSR